MKIALISILVLVLTSCWDPDAYSDMNSTTSDMYDIDNDWQSIQDSVAAHDSNVDLLNTYQYGGILDMYETYKGYLKTEEDKGNAYYREAADYARAHLDSIHALQRKINKLYGVK